MLDQLQSVTEADTDFEVYSSTRVTRLSVQSSFLSKAKEAHLCINSGGHDLRWDTHNSPQPMPMPMVSVGVSG